MSAMFVETHTEFYYSFWLGEEFLFIFWINLRACLQACLPSGVLFRLGIFERIYRQTCSQSYFSTFFHIVM